MRKLCLAIIVMAGLCATSGANGYKIICVNSARTTAMGDACVAQVDDPSAIVFNPAGLGQLRGDQVEVGAVVMDAFAEHTSPGGVKTDIRDQWQVVPSFYATSDFGFKNMAFGLGVSFPNGLSSEWARDSFARYVATYSSLMVADISPAVGVRLGAWMLGAGVSWYESRADLRSMVDLGLLSGAPGRMDVERRIKGDGNGWGGNVGAVYMLNTRHSVGLTYRLPHTIDYDGTMTISQLGLSSDAESAIDFPGVVVAGYAFKPVKKLKVELDLDWTDWSSVGDIIATPKTPGLQNVVMRQDLRNTIACKLGVEYRASETVAWRAGYVFNENATPPATWRPSLPDTDAHMFSAGLGYTVRNLTIDSALQVVCYRTRSINNNVDANELLSSSSIDGTYRNWAPCLSMSATYRF